MFNLLNRFAPRRAPPVAWDEDDRHGLKAQTLGYYQAPNGQLFPLTAMKDGPQTVSGLGAWMDSWRGMNSDQLRDAKQGYALAYSASEWAYRCVDVLEQKIGDILRGAKVYDRRTDKEIEGHRYLEAVDMCYREYDQDIYAEWVFALSVYGEAYIEIVRADTSGTGLEGLAIPLTVRRLNNLVTEPNVGANNVIESFSYFGGGVAGGQTTTTRIAPQWVVFDKKRDPFNDVRGLSPMHTALRAVNVDLHIKTFTRSYFQNDARPGIVFTVKDGLNMSDADYERLLSRITERGKGPRNSFKPMVLPYSANVTPIDHPDLGAQQGLTDEQKERIAATFGIPVGIVTFGNVRYQLSPEQRISLYEETILPRARAILRVINTRLLPRFDPTGYGELRIDEATVKALLENIEQNAALVSQQLASGRITINEARIAEGKQPLPNGDVLLLPSGVVPIPLAQLGNALALMQQASGPSGGSAPDTGAEPPRFGPPKQNVAPSVGTEQEATNKDGQRDEILTWQRFAKRNGVAKALRFAVKALDDHNALLIRGDLELLPKDAPPEALREVFDRALDRAARKAIQATQLDFENAFTDLLDSLDSKSPPNASAFRAQLRDLLADHGRQAYIDGLHDGGVDDDPDEDDEAEIKRLLSDQTQYVDAITTALYKDGVAISNAQADMKPGMWWNKSVYPFYLGGQLSANGNANHEWVYGDTIEHCPDCKTLNGQVHRLKAYVKSGFVPKSDKLSCKGFQCDCRTVPTSKRAYGRFPRASA